RRRLNEAFTRSGLDWVAYGEFSGFKLLPGYRGPRPAGGDFVPYGGGLARLGGPRDGRLVDAVPPGGLVAGGGPPGPGGVGGAGVERTAAAAAGSVDLLRAEGLA